MPIIVSDYFSVASERSVDVRVFYVIVFYEPDLAFN